MDFLKDLVRCIPLEGRGAGHQFVESGSEGVDIVGRGGGFPHGLPGTGVPKRSQGLGFKGVLILLPVQDSGDAEVGELNGRSFGQKEIAGLEVAMEHADAIVRIVKGGGQLTRDLNHQPPIHHSTFCLMKIGAEVIAFDVLHLDERHSAFRSVEVMNSNNVGMV